MFFDNSLLFIEKYDKSDMRTRSKLPRFFHHLFAVLEVLPLIAGVIVCGLVVALPRISHNAELEVGLGDIGLAPESGALTAQAGDSKAETISIKNLRGTISVRNPDGGNGILDLTRWSILPLCLVYAGFITVLFDFLRRLFRNVERGESFTERSVHLVHKIGMTIIVFTFLSAAAATWHDHAVSNYLNQHATVQGLKMAFTVPHDNSFIFGSRQIEFHFSWMGILTGLLVLSLGEVFRQGLALKEENELTI